MVPRSWPARLWFRRLWFHRLLAASAVGSLTMLWACRRSRRRPQPRQDPRRLVTEKDRISKNAAEGRVQHRTHICAESRESIPYALYVPPGYDAKTAAPLLVALHGLFHEYDSLLTSELLDLAAEHGMIVVSPLGYTQDGWYGAPDLINGGCTSTQDTPL